MAKLTLGLRTVAPTFLKGSEPRGIPEFRVPSVRGQLRYWLRAMVGAQTADTQVVWRREAAAFGSTGGGSPVTLRLSKGVVNQKDNNDKPYQAFLLPHRDPPDKPSPEKAIKPDTAVTLTLQTRPGVPMSEDVLKALELWLLLGGVGKRSRRMMGGLRVSKVGAESVNIPDWMTNPDLPAADWIEVYRTVLGNLIPKTTPAGGVPDFPTLHPQHACVLVGERLFVDAPEANRALFRQLIRNPKFRSDSDAFGYAGGGRRRASPVIAQVRRAPEGQVFPVITILRSSPLKPHNWKTVMNDFIDELQNTFSAHIVYGGKFA